ncbi:hypothetical protein PHLGIDRAFT_78686 [Phlebiopsis gigantea 11061_1 CR5-6]|uniref:N-acetyltransferase domain-containing protein n=1 Tax=Phlebiopsis gigantea (strain 11061_1 CR5-6) TaxID=745531 RepID=A0A0C3S0X6_PHLG1|nr:hypothetical protein PHLGIDRAFT_78686 [Phlebiopsis gigantea 11061_1 CR5-6]
MPVTPLELPRSAPINPEVLEALYAITTTPYDNSFLSRIRGFQPSAKPPALAVDWESRTPWMDLMCDIRDHYSLMHPEREHPAEVEAPIEYVTLQPSHLDQVHDLLARAFWSGIDVTDSLAYSPERCTVITMYKKVVIGVALLSSPQETYINYLVVRAGWDNAQIAT